MHRPAASKLDRWQGEHHSYGLVPRQPATSPYGNISLCADPATVFANLPSFRSENRRLERDERTLHMSAERVSDDFDDEARTDPPRAVGSPSDRSSWLQTSTATKQRQCAGIVSAK